MGSCSASNMNMMMKWGAFIDKKKRSTINKESETSSIESDVNPPVTKHRGKPATKRFNAATEKPRRQPYTCRKCGKTGHNSARCGKKNS